MLRLLTTFLAIACVLLALSRLGRPSSFPVALHPSTPAPVCTSETREVSVASSVVASAPSKVTPHAAPSATSAHPGAQTGGQFLAPAALAKAETDSLSQDDQPRARLQIAPATQQNGARPAHVANRIVRSSASTSQAAAPIPAVLAPDLSALPLSSEQLTDIAVLADEFIDQIPVAADPSKELPKETAQKITTAARVTEQRYRQLYGDYALAELRRVAHLQLSPTASLP